MYYSLFEAHHGGSWWLHRGAANYSTPEEAEDWFKKHLWWDQERPHKVFEHLNPFPEGTFVTSDFVHFQDDCCIPLLIAEGKRIISIKDNE